MFKETIIEITELTDVQRSQMFELMTLHYNNCDRTTFFSDLIDKEGVLLLSDDTGKIVGFSTYKITNAQINGEDIRVLFSGDTIMDSVLWGSRSPFRIFGRLLNNIISRETKPLYWFLISKGHRTYLFLPLFFKTFYPNHLSTTPAVFKTLLNQLCLKKFGKSCEKNKLTVAAGASSLKAEYGKVEAHKLNNPHINFFYQQNPNYLQGDELLCIAAVTSDNLTSFGKLSVLL